MHFQCTAWIIGYFISKHTYQMYVDVFVFTRKSKYQVFRPQKTYYMWEWKQILSHGVTHRIHTYMKYSWGQKSCHALRLSGHCLINPDCSWWKFQCREYHIFCAHFLSLWFSNQINWVKVEFIHPNR